MIDKDVAQATPPATAMTRSEVVRAGPPEHRGDASVSLVDLMVIVIVLGILLLMAIPRLFGAESERTVAATAAVAERMKLRANEVRDRHVERGVEATSRDRQV